MSPSEYAQGLVQKQGLDVALRIVENCQALTKGLLSAEEVPGIGDEIEVVEETFKSKEGKIQTRERIHIDRVMQSKRIKRNAAFWTNTLILVRKMKTAADQKKNAQT